MAGGHGVGRAVGEAACGALEAQEPPDFEHIAGGPVSVLGLQETHGVHLLAVRSETVLAGRGPSGGARMASITAFTAALACAPSSGVAAPV